MNPAVPAAPPRLARLYRRVGAQIEVMGARCSGADERLLAHRPEVSGWAVAQHLEHLGMTGGRVFDAIGIGLDGGPAGRPGFWGYLVLVSGRIPRGRVRARREWTPAGADAGRARGAVADLGRRFAALEAHLPAIATAAGTARHPILGPLTPRRWLRFLEIHQRHHLAIVHEIEAAAGAGGRTAAG